MDLFGTDYQPVSYPTEVVDYLETAVKPLHPTAAINVDFDAYQGILQGVAVAVRANNTNAYGIANTHVLGMHDTNGEYWGVVKFFDNIWLCQF